MKYLMNAFKSVAQQATQSRAATRHGIVTSYDPKTYAVKVQLQPEGVLTGWIPLKSAWSATAGACSVRRPLATRLRSTFRKTMAAMAVRAGASITRLNGPCRVHPANSGWCIGKAHN